MQSAYVWPKAGKGPATVTNLRYFENPDYRDLVLFNEYFNGGIQAKVWTAAVRSNG